MVEDASKSDSNATPKGGQLPVIAPVELRALKEEAPVPFGITVINDEETEESPVMTPVLIP